MNDLQRLKARLLKQEPSEQDQVYNLCAVMEVCGGYDVLCGFEEEIEYKFWKFKWKKKVIRGGMPLTALNQIMKYLEYVNKQTEKSMPKVSKFRKR